MQLAPPDSFKFKAGVGYKANLPKELTELALSHDCFDQSDWLFETYCARASAGGVVPRIFVYLWADDHVVFAWERLYSR